MSGVDMNMYWLAVVIVVSLPHFNYAQEKPSSKVGGVVSESLQEVLSAMLANNKAIRSLTLNVTAKEKYSFGDRQYTLKIKVLFLSDGKWYTRYDRLDTENRPIETLIIKDDKCDILNHQLKSVTRSQMNGNFVKKDVEELSGICFPITPLLSGNKEYLNKHFKSSIVQSDKDYTWIKFVPKTSIKQRDVSVAQIGVINYKTSVSPANFPLYIEWIEPGGTQFTWQITQALSNDVGLVRESDFTIELREYERNGWSIQRNDGFVVWKAFIGLFTKEPEVPGWIRP